MLLLIIRFITLLVVSLLVGTMFGIWLGYNPAALTASAYVEMQQNAIRGLNISLPALGLVSIIFIAGLAVVTKDDNQARFLLIGAVVCLIVAGLITRFANQPINAIVMTWNPQSPPPNWMELRSTWWFWHILRTVISIAALALMIIEVLSHHRATH